MLAHLVLALLCLAAPMHAAVVCSTSPPDLGFMTFTAADSTSGQATLDTSTEPAFGLVRLQVKATPNSVTSKLDLISVSLSLTALVDEDGETQPPTSDDLLAVRTVHVEDPSFETPTSVNYAVPVEFPQCTRAGMWKITNVVLRDVSGLSRSLDSEALLARHEEGLIEQVALNVSSSCVEAVEPLSLQDVVFTTTELDVSTRDAMTQMNVTLNAVNRPGVSAVRATLGCLTESCGGVELVMNWDISSSQGPSDGPVSFVLDVHIYEGLRQGTYALERLSLVDQIDAWTGGGSVYDALRFQEEGISVPLLRVLNSATNDSALPAGSDFSMFLVEDSGAEQLESVDTARKSAELFLQVQLSDDVRLLPTESVRIVLVFIPFHSESPSIPYTLSMGKSNRISGDPRLGVYRMSKPIPQHHTAGTFKLTSAGLQVFDAAGRVAHFSGAELGDPAVRLLCDGVGPVSPADRTPRGGNDSNPAGERAAMAVGLGLGVLFAMFIGYRYYARKQAEKEEQEAAGAAVPLSGQDYELLQG